MSSSWVLFRTFNETKHEYFRFKTGKSSIGLKPSIIASIFYSIVQYKMTCVCLALAQLANVKTGSIKNEKVSLRFLNFFKSPTFSDMNPSPNRLAVVFVSCSLSLAQYCIPAVLPLDFNTVNLIPVNPFRFGYNLHRKLTRYRPKGYLNLIAFHGLFDFVLRLLPSITIQSS